MATPNPNAQANADASITGTCPACNAENVKLKDVSGIPVCEKCASKRFSIKVRKRIQEASEAQAAKKEREIWHKRIDVAKRGIEFFDKKNPQSALRTFKDYILILERHFKVEPGGLKPSHFEGKNKREIQEVLLISGIFWDLAKIYDHLKGKRSETKYYLNKFIEFSINRPHAIIASEAIRKYISTKNAVNEQDFKNAHKVLRDSIPRCFIASAVFGGDSEEVGFLQEFRDQKLEKKWAGRAFIKTYYRVSPSIACGLLQWPILQPPARLALRMMIRVLKKRSN